jgi:uncharacterized protein
MNRHLIVFVKNSELGKVKTRLAATVGNDQALAIYKSLLQITSQNIKDLHCTIHIYYSSFIDDQDLFSGQNVLKSIQKDGDLGEKMRSAFQDIFSHSQISHHAKKVMIIGSDCPELNSELINQGFAALEKSNVVIGPTFDGGYYCLGMDAYRPELFSDVAWSTSDVLHKTISNAENLNLSVFQLPMLHDIDYEEDWIAYLSRQKQKL